MRILAIGAHPDDLEIVCAGTLARYARAGHKVFLCHACNGDKGHFHIPPAELAQTRIQEAQRAAALIGAEAIYLGFSDAEIFSESLEARLPFVDVIRATRPDLIITHYPQDYMPDHIAVSKLVFAATFCASLPHLRTKHPAYDAVPPLYFMDTLAGMNFQPQEYVDITETIEIKTEMLRQHQSQITWMAEHDHVDIVDFMQTMGKFRGLQCGVKYAEGFIPHLVYPSVTTTRLLP